MHFTLANPEEILREPGSRLRVQRVRQACRWRACRWEVCVNWSATGKALQAATQEKG